MRVAKCIFCFSAIPKLHYTTIRRSSLFGTAQRRRQTAFSEEPEKYKHILQINMSEWEPKTSQAEKHSRVGPKEMAGITSEVPVDSLDN